MSDELRKPPDDEDAGDDGELSNVPLLEDNWEVNEETGETEWVPFMLTSSPLPGFPSPVRYAEWLGASDEDGQLVKPFHE